ncbi:hypothetical protein GCM10023320_76760 [Pseudonocardia adelaidensis]|uniref:SMODS-associating 2TM beta-strand rich effector domain-containing protein n=1 Tax=Pseudonocardia adelaidensis TaxID=648754 RepID=A0ABP9P2Y0_9PSEU
MRALTTRPDVVALRVDRVRAQVDALLWAGIVLGLLFTTVNVHRFAAAGAGAFSPGWWVAWLLDSMVSLVLLAVLRAEQITARYQVTLGVWPRRAKWCAFAATYLMNTWTSWGLNGEALSVSGVMLVSGSLRFADQSIDNATSGQALQQSPAPGLYRLDADNLIVRVPALDTFDIAPGFTGLSVFGDTEYMVCHITTTAEDSNTRGASTAKFTLIVNQWKSDGTLCHTDATTTVTKTVPYAVHRIYVPLNKPNFLVSTAPGRIPRFNAYVRGVGSPAAARARRTA